MIKLLASTVILSFGLMLIGCSSNPVNTVNHEQEEITTGAFPQDIADWIKDFKSIPADKRLNKNQTATFSINCPKTVKLKKKDINNQEWLITYKIENAKIYISQNWKKISIVSQSMKVGGKCTVTVKAGEDNVHIGHGTLALEMYGKAKSWNKTNVKK